VRRVEDKPFDDPYSDNVIDICPVGALLSRSFFYKARVWFLKATPSVCPGCERGCTVRIWHRSSDRRLKALEDSGNRRIMRVTPLDNPAVNGHWICNKGRDLALIFERPRAECAMRRGAPVELAEAVREAKRLIAAAARPVALVSSWGSDEELAAFRDFLAGKFKVFVKKDHEKRAGEILEDNLLIRADKNPNTRGAVALFGDSPLCFASETDLVLIWGEGADFSRLPSGAKTLLLAPYLAPENGHADVFFPVTVQTERAGHYTNFQGVKSGFSACFSRPRNTVDAAWLFEALGGPP
jgi:NADH-quinone oxidoreductase subunit G